MLAFASALVASLAAGLVAASPHDVARRHHAVPKDHAVDQNNTLFRREDNARLTMYYQTGNAGACGGYNKDSDFVSGRGAVIRHLLNLSQIVALNYQVGASR